MLSEQPLAYLFFDIRSSCFFSLQQMPTNKQLWENILKSRHYQGLAKRAPCWLFRSLLQKVSHQSQINCQS